MNIINESFNKIIKSIKQFKKLIGFKIFSIIAGIASILSLILAFGTTIVRFFNSIINAINIIHKLILIIATVLFLLIRYLIKKSDENQQLKQTIYDGLEFTYNGVKVIADIKDRKYRFFFQKNFIIKTDNHPKWFKGQFYCNKHLSSKKTAKEYYKNNPIKWKALKVQAQLQYKNPGDKNFSEKYDLEIENITDESFYIPYHILYSTKEGSDIPLPKNTEIRLFYNYEISAELWGSYLNRHLSFFAEKTEFEFVCKCKEKKEPKLQIANVFANGDPVIMKNKVKISKNEDSGLSTYSFQLPQKRNAKYRVLWSSKNLFNIANTKNGPDDSKLTTY